MTLQVVTNPLLRRGSPIHARAFAALRDLDADYVRYVPWYPYPRLAVAALEPPGDGRTSWDFSLIDPMTVDFLEATRGRRVILNFSTIPQWMFDTGYRVWYPDDPDEASWSYSHGSDLRDPSMRELGDYYERLVSWYTRGGFTDEYGRRHESGHRYKIDYWEVLNEPDLEHILTPEQYTAYYDAIVSAIRRVAPEMKFVGISLAFPGRQPRFFEYFLDPKNHQPGIPLDMISYHFYALPTPDQSSAVHQYTFFEQADRFVDVVRFIEAVRLRLSPQTRTTINEVGSILPNDIGLGRKDVIYFTHSYWNLSAALFAYLYAHLALLGIDIVGQSQLVGFPSQFPSVTMLDWTTGRPNARYWTLKLLKDNFGPGDVLVDSSVNSPYAHAQAFVTRDGRRKLLVVNKRDRDFSFQWPEAEGATVEVVDQTTSGGPPPTVKIEGTEVTVRGFGVAVVTLARRGEAP